MFLSLSLQKIFITNLSYEPTLKQLLDEVRELTAKVKSLEARNAALVKENQSLKREVAALKRQLEQSKIKKNSKNSHTPPSLDLARKNQSLREKSGRKPGGQDGHEGQTLQMVVNPDKEISHIPAFCKHCGADLSGISCELLGSRQVVKIPQVEPCITQHNVYGRVCKCGYCTKGEFPVEAIAPIGYGTGIESLTTYLHTRQYLPFKRIQEFFRDFANLNISVGTLCKMVTRMSKKALPFYEEIKSRLLQSPVVGSDETGVKVHGNKGWMWTWQNDGLTFIAHSENRGFATVEEHFKEGFPNSVLVHDRYAAHFKTSAAAHQMCLVHLQRDLQYLNDLYKGQNQWVLDLKCLLKRATELKRQLSAEDYFKPNQQRTQIEEELEELLSQQGNENLRDLITLRNSLLKHRDAILTFLYHPKVPPDNNGSERAIRNIKVKQKVSGSFRSAHGAKEFAILRSITDTVIKNGTNVLVALNLVANLEAE